MISEGNENIGKGKPDIRKSLCVSTAGEIFTFYVTHSLLMKLKEELFFYEQRHNKKIRELILNPPPTEEIKLVWTGEKTTRKGDSNSNIFKHKK